MISREALGAYSGQVDSLARDASAAVERAVLEWARSHPRATPAETREAVVRLLESSIGALGEASSSLAAEWYDAMASEVQARLPAAGASYEVPAGLIERTVRYQLGKALAGDTGGFARACGGLASECVKRSANATVMANAGRDAKRGVRFARVPSGAETCAFCYMLASRGAVYRTSKTAGEFDHWHRNCDCRVVPGFGDDPDAEIVEGYDPAGMRDRLHAIEGMTGLSFAESGDLSRISEFMELLDPGWLYGGKEATVCFASSQVEKRAGDAEVRTAKRLASFGFSAEFIQDYDWIVDGGRKRKVGLPDLASGVEIKTLGTSRNPYGAIDNYLRNASGKRGLKLVAVDNCDSLFIDDERLMEASRDIVGDYPEIPHLALLLKDGTLRHIK